MDDARRPSLVALRTLLAPLSWGTTYVVITELMPDDRPLFAAALRVVPAGLVLLIVGRFTSAWRPRGRQWRHTVALATCNFAVFFPLLFVATYRMPGGVAAAFGGLQPLFVVTLSWLFGGRRPTLIQLVVGFVGVIGVALVVVRPGATVDVVGVVAGIAATVSFALGVVLTRTLPTPPNPVSSTGWQLLVGGALLTPLALLVEGLPGEFTGRNLAGTAYLSLIGTACAYLLWFGGIRKLPVVAPPLLGLAAPITGAIVGWIALDQDLGPTQLAGLAITVGSIAYGALVAPRQPLPPPTEAVADPVAADRDQHRLEPVTAGGRRSELEACSAST